jgi:hypothetical protein
MTTQNHTPGWSGPTYTRPAVVSIAGLALGVGLLSGYAIGHATTQPRLDHCAEALDAAEKTFGISADATQAAVRWDSDAIHAATVDIKRITPVYQAAATECRGL